MLLSEAESDVKILNKHKTHQDAKTLIFDVEFEDGEKLNNAVLKCKKIEKL